MRESRQLKKHQIFARLESLGEYSGKVLKQSGQIIDVDFVTACELEYLHGDEILEKGDERIYGESRGPSTGQAMGTDQPSGDSESAGDNSTGDSDDGAGVHTNKKRRSTKKPRD